jgi:hypothetical protein
MRQNKPHQFCRNLVDGEGVYKVKMMTRCRDFHSGGGSGWISVMAPLSSGAKQGNF